MGAPAQSAGTGLILEMMVSCGMGTPQSLADRFGMTDSHFTRIRRNRIPMSLEMAAEIASRIGLHLMQLWMIPVLSDQSLRGLKTANDPFASSVLAVAARFGCLESLDGRNEILAAYCRDLFGRTKEAPANLRYQAHGSFSG